MPRFFPKCNQILDGSMKCGTTLMHWLLFYRVFTVLLPSSIVEVKSTLHARNSSIKLSLFPYPHPDVNSSIPFLFPRRHSFAPQNNVTELSVISQKNLSIQEPGRGWREALSTYIPAFTRCFQMFRKLSHTRTTLTY